MGKHVAAIVVGLVLASFFLWFAWTSASLRDVAHTLVAHTDFRLALPFLGIYAGFFWLKTLRWHLLLTPIHATTVRQLFPSVMLGYAGNVLLPAQLGEAARAYALSRRLRSNSSPILTNLALERLFDLFALAVWLEVALLLNSKAFPSLQVVRYGLGLGIAVGAGLTVFYLYRTERFVSLCRRSTAFLPAANHAWFVRQVERGATGLQSLRYPHLLVRIAALSFLMWGLMSACVYLALIAVGVQAPFSAAVVVLAVTVVGLALPTGPGFVGTIQACFLVALTPYSIVPVRTLAASLFYHLLITVPPLLVACCLLVLSARSANAKTPQLARATSR
jgi:hypothetical protein